MACERSRGIVLALSLCALPSATSAQTQQTITVTGMANAAGPVTGGVAVALVRGGGTDLLGLQSAFKKVGIVDVVEDNTPLSHYGLAVGLRGRLPAVTTANLSAVTDAVEEYVKAHRGASVVRIGFVGLAVDCPPIAANARVAALADARDRAQAIAQSSGARLGAVVSVKESDGCPPPGRLGGVPYAINAQALTMTVPVQEIVTYAMSP